MRCPPLRSSFRYLTSNVSFPFHFNYILFISLHQRQHRVWAQLSNQSRFSVRTEWRRLRPFDHGHAFILIVPSSQFSRHPSMAVRCKVNPSCIHGRQLTATGRHTPTSSCTAGVLHYNTSLWLRLPCLPLPMAPGCRSAALGPASKPGGRVSASRARHGSGCAHQWQLLVCCGPG